MFAWQRFWPFAAILTAAVLVPMLGYTAGVSDAAAGNDGRAQARQQPIHPDTRAGRGRPAGCPAAGLGCRSRSGREARAAQAGRGRARTAPGRHAPTARFRRRPAAGSPDVQQRHLDCNRGPVRCRSRRDRPSPR